MTYEHAEGVTGEHSSHMEFESPYGGFGSSYCLPHAEMGHCIYYCFSLQWTLLCLVLLLVPEVHRSGNMRNLEMEDAIPLNLSIPNFASTYGQKYMQIMWVIMVLTA